MTSLSGKLCTIILVSLKLGKMSVSLRAGLKPIGPVATNRAIHSILQTLLQVDWEPGSTVIVPNWAPHLLRLALSFTNTYEICLETLPSFFLFEETAVEVVRSTISFHSMGVTCVCHVMHIQ